MFYCSILRVHAVPTYLYPSPFQKMNARFASQTFSATVAAGMRTCIESGVLSSTAETTIMFID